jgi:hypothetical protein
MPRLRVVLAACRIAVLRAKLLVCVESVEGPGETSALLEFV